MPASQSNTNQLGKEIQFESCLWTTTTAILRLSGSLFGTTRVSRYQKKHSSTHRILSTNACHEASQCCITAI